MGSPSTSAVAKPALDTATSGCDSYDARLWADQGVTNAFPASCCANQRGLRFERAGAVPGR